MTANEEGSTAPSSTGDLPQIRPGGHARLKLLTVGLLLLLAVVFVVYQPQPPKSLGRLVFLEHGSTGSNDVVRVRWEQQDKRLTIGGSIFGADETGTLWEVPFASVLTNGWDESKQELVLLVPTNAPARWFLESDVFEPIRGLPKLYIRARACLSSKSLSPLWEDIGLFYRTLGTVRSDYVTNLAPASTAGPGPAR